MILRKIKFCSLNISRRHFYLTSLKTHAHLLGSCQFPEKYSPSNEGLWYDHWKSSGYFQSSNKEKCMVMVLPPPNITGNLHIGHSMTVTIQDCIVRWYKMHGVNVSWIPSIDHAGIGTQIIVEKLLWSKYGKTRKEIGRDNLIKHIWDWKTEKEKEIYQQLESMGCSLDWNKLSFTLDEEFSKCVQEAFIHLYDKGHISQKPRIVNWCSYLNSAISDLEVEHIEVSGPTKLKVPGHSEEIIFGKMYTISYPYFGDNSGNLLVSTTRPETILGDVALAVHPDDTRHYHLIGKWVKNPLTGQSMPIVSSPLVKADFGTGIVKVTPGHDELDYQIALSSGLSAKIILTDEGNIVDGFGELSGLKRYDARREILFKLAQGGFLHSSTSHSMAVPICSRSGDVIEPLLKNLWTLEVKSVSEQCVDQVKNGLLKINPSFYNGIWFDYLDKNVRDWCLSRQLWWGHGIPVYYCQTNGEEVKVAARNEEEARKKASVQLNVSEDEIKSIQQDPDVLDTWFSSSLYPLVLSGWPEVRQTEAPITIMETGYDILFFWVSRMVMMNLLLEQRLPFENVLLHGVILDKHGKKMSKSKGNVIDPLSIIKGNAENEGMGADALRMALLSVNVQVQQIRFDTNTVVKYKHFCNKMLQASKLISQLLQHPSGEDVPVTLNIERWLKSRLHSTLSECEHFWKEYNFHLVLNSFYNFFYNDICDVYLEVAKLCRRENKNIKGLSETAFECLIIFFRAFHPIAPFITEDLYHRLHSICSINRLYESLMVAPYPTAEELNNNHDTTLERNFADLVQIAQSIRQFKSTSSIPLKNNFSVVIQDKMEMSSDEFSLFVKSLARCREVIWTEQPPQGKTIPIIDTGSRSAWIVLEDNIDIRNEIERITNKCEKLETKLNELEKKFHKGKQDKLKSKVSSVMGDLEKYQSILYKLKAFR